MRDPPAAWCGSRGTPNRIEIPIQDFNPARRHGRPIRARILFGLGGTTVLGIGMIAVMLTLLLRGSQSFTDESDRIYGSIEASNRLAADVGAQQRAVLDYRLGGSSAAVDAYSAAQRDEVDQLRALSALAPHDMTLSSLLDSLQATIAAWREPWADPIIRAPLTGPPPTDGALSQARGQALFADVEAGLASLNDSAAQQRIHLLSAARASATVAGFGLAGAGIGLALIGLLICWWIVRTVLRPLGLLSQTALDDLAGKEVSFHSDRDDEIGVLAQLLERMRVTIGHRYVAARQDAERAATLNQLSELMSLSTTEAELVEATIRTLARLVPSPRGDVQLANASASGLVYAGSWGSDPPPIGAQVPVDRIERCPGIRRAAAFLVDDVADDLAVRCPAHRSAEGGLACVPLIAMGKVAGVVHLESLPGRPFDETAIGLATRVAEQVAIAIANTRLMKTMESLAMTDGLTGLRNARFFDSYLEQELAAAERDGESIALVMMDIDQFKAFNDTHGHPAGDEALRTFARVLKASVRASDVVARYGGEEFIVALRHTTLEGAKMVAEKIRASVEQTIIEIAPTRFARMTVSLGVVATDAHPLDQRALMSLVDAALYRAKEQGRNRVVTGPTPEPAVPSVIGRRKTAKSRQTVGAGADPEPILPKLRSVKSRKGA